jgi:hypothetical protein
MHRSGTSCLAGIVQECGVYLGDVSEVNQYNMRGNREHPGIVSMHDHVLRTSGGSWDDPPATVSWGSDDRARLNALVAEFNETAAVWGFKDPRTVLVADGWLEATPHVEFLGVFRHPTTVAASLAARGRIPPHRAVELWLTYNRRLLALHDASPFPLVCFDLAPDVFLEAVLARLDSLGLSPGNGGLSFFDPALRRADASASEEAPAPALRLYAELLERS